MPIKKMSNSETFGFRLQEFRKGKGLSQIEFAARLDTTNVTIGRYERNEIMPGAGFLYLLMERFPDLNAEWMMRGIEPMLLSRASPGYVQEDETGYIRSDVKADLLNKIRDLRKIIEGLR